MASTRVAPSSSSAASSDLGAKSMGSLGVDEYLRNIYGDAGEGRAVEVWGDIPGGRRGDDGEVTLEDFLARAGAVREEDVRAAVAASVFEVDPVGLGIENQVLGFGNEVEGVRGGGGRGGRGRKRPAMDPADRAAVQRQKRMIKNRESAARSRERKQAYTVELETLVTQLEEENARLLKELEEQNRERLPQLLKNLIPVTEERKPPRALRRTGSAMW